MCSQTTNTTPKQNQNQQKPLSGGVFDSNQLVQTYSDAVRDCELQLLKEIKMSLFVPADTYNLLQPHNVTEDVMKKTNCHLSWADEEQGCRMLTITGTAFGVHACHLLMVQTICESEI